MLDRCPHRAAALSEGRMTAAGHLQCAYHGTDRVLWLPDYILSSYNLTPAVPWHGICILMQLNIILRTGLSGAKVLLDLLCPGWSFDGETGNCTNIPQVTAGGTVSGRTCGIALPCVEYQGMVWVYPSPGANPSADTIVGELPLCSC
jgi:phenylpropionate dioxygenase-like ring-hydroxylating dioxygenase large terminal subunit